jgi:hypothetical protein
MRPVVFALALAAVCCLGLCAAPSADAQCYGGGVVVSGAGCYGGYCAPVVQQRAFLVNPFAVHQFGYGGYSGVSAFGYGGYAAGGVYQSPFVVRQFAAPVVVKQRVLKTYAAPAGVKVQVHGGY